MDLSSLRRPRRIVTAIILFAVLAGGGLATAVATDVVVAESLSFEVPPGQVGDDVMVEVRYVRFSEPGAPVEDIIPKEVENRDMRFQWLEPETFAYADGRMMTMPMLRTNYTFVGTDESWEGTLATNPDHGAVAAYFYRMDDTEEWTRETLIGDEPMNTERTRAIRDFYPYESDGFEHLSSIPYVPCGIISALQGKTWQVGQTVEESGRCRGFTSPITTRAWSEVVAVTPDAMLVEHWVHRYADNGNFITDEDQISGRSWYVPDVPYPVRNEMYFGFGPTVPTAVTTLVGYDGGDEPLSYRVEGETQGLSEAPTTSWLFDDSGTDFAFKLSEAWQAALDDLESGFSDFMASHPNAVLISAEVETDEYAGMPDRTIITWRLTVSDTTDNFRVRIDRETQEPFSLLGTQTTVRDQERADHSFQPDVPAALPTIQSLIEVWQLHSGRDDANYFGFKIRDGEQNEIEVSVGVQTRSTSSQGTGSHDHSRLYWSLEQDLPWRFDEGASESGPGEAQPAPSPAPDLHPASVEATVAPGWAIDVEAAAGIGAGAILVALGYYLWPVAKSGGLLLFSRVRHDKVLDHPVRQQIYDAIQEQPGIHFQALRRSAEAGDGVVDHHLQKLLGAGLVNVHKGAGHTCYFASGGVDRRVMAAAPLLKSPVAAGIVANLRSEPGVRTGELAKRLSVAPATISYHLSRLRDQGFVTTTGTDHRLTELGHRIDT